MQTIPIEIGIASVVFKASYPDISSSIIDSNVKWIMSPKNTY